MKHLTVEDVKKILTDVSRDTARITVRVVHNSWITEYEALIFDDDAKGDEVVINLGPILRSYQM